MYSWHRRGWAVGIAPLPPKKVSNGTRLAWEESIIQAGGGRAYDIWSDMGIGSPHKVYLGSAIRGS